MNTILRWGLLLTLLPLAGCASQGYYGTGYSHGGHVYGSRSSGYVSYTTPGSNLWLDWPVWSLDYGYSPAWYAGGWSIGWLGYDPDPWHGGVLYSPLIHGGLDHGWRHDSPHWRSARHEVEHLRHDVHMPHPARRHGVGHGGHRVGDAGHGLRVYTHGQAPATHRSNRVRQVRSAFGVVDGHRGRSSVGEPHSGRRGMPFNRQPVLHLGERRTQPQVRYGYTSDPLHSRPARRGQAVGHAVYGNRSTPHAVRDAEHAKPAHAPAYNDHDRSPTAADELRRHGYGRVKPVREGVYGGSHRGRYQPH